MRRSRLLMWQYASPAAEELLLTPPDLRPQDASFIVEVAAGSFGLAGRVANLKGRSPFAVEPPSGAWTRELHGFGWLRHLEAAGSRDAAVIAQNLVADWIRRSVRGKHPEDAWRAEVVARRSMSWLSHSSLLLDGSDAKRYAAVMRSISAQITYLATAWREAADGYPRLVALIGQVHAALCIAGHDRKLAQAQALLVAELHRQFPTDGGHVGRNAWVLVELLLDLLPLRRCFAARNKTADPALLASIKHMVEMLRHLRMGDGTLLIDPLDGSEPVVMSERLVSWEYGITLPPLEPRLFSFNSPHGACPSCDGLGVRSAIDPARVIPDETRTLREGAVAAFGRRGSLATATEVSRVV